MTTPYHLIVLLTRQEGRKWLYNKIVDVFQHILVMMAFILFFSFLQMLINK